MVFPRGLESPISAPAAAAAAPPTGREASATERWAFLALLISHQVVLNAVWVARDAGPPGWDQSIPLVKSLLLKQAYEVNGLVGLLRAFPAVDTWQPPLLGLLILPAYAVAGVAADAAQWVNHAAVVVLSLAVYGLGARLAGPAAGLVAVYAAGTMPLLYALSRQSYPEFPLAAVTTAALYLTVRSEDFRRRGIGVALGVVLGLGLLLKMSFPVFVAGPLLVVAAGRLREAGGRVPPGLVADLAAVAVPAALVAAPWYMPNAWSGLAYGLSAAYGTVASLENFGPIRSPLTLLRFLELFLAWGPSYFYALLFVTLLLLPAAPVPSRTRPLVAAWVLGALVVFATALNKDIRYLAPLVPGLALLLADRLVRVWGPWPLAARGVLLLVPLVSLYAVSFTPLGSPHGRGGVLERATHGMGAGFFAHPPGREDWKTGAIVRALDPHATRPGAPDGRVRVVLTTNHRAFHKDLFNYTSLALGRPYRFRPLPHYDPNAGLPGTLRALAEADLVLGTTGWQGPGYATRYNAALHALLDRGELPFTRVPLDLRLPDGSQVRLYRRVSQEVSHAPAR